MLSPRTVLGHSLAYAEKDLKIALRFKVSFFSGLFAPALANFALFGTVMFGFVSYSSSNATGLTAQNFVAFTFLGALSSTLVGTGFNSYSTRFMPEKYWQTASVLLASPLTPFEMLIGTTISDLLRFSIVGALFLILSYIAFPVGILTVAYAIVVLIVMYFLISGISLIRGALILVNENIDPLITYFILGTSYLSCFFYPASFIPSILRPFAMINPIYFLVDSLRSVWLGVPVPFYYPLIGVASVFASLLIGTYIFKKIWRNLDITGY